MSLDQNIVDRLSRASSWLLAASALERETKLQKFDHHTLFIYRYIAFNSLYGRWKVEETQYRACMQFDLFFDNLIKLHLEDKKKNGPTKLILPNALVKCKPQWVELIENEFLDKRGYWDIPFHSRDFIEKYRVQKSAALRQLDWRNFKPLLHLIFDRIWILRNQIMHGGATYGPDSAGWESVEIANPVLRALIPAFYSLMKAYPETVKWPPIPYPRYGSDQHVKRPPKSKI